MHSPAAVQLRLMPTDSPWLAQTAANCTCLYCVLEKVATAGASAGVGRTPAATPGPAGFLAGLYLLRMSSGIWPPFFTGRLLPGAVAAARRRAAGRAAEGAAYARPARRRSSGIRRALAGSATCYARSNDRVKQE